MDNNPQVFDSWWLFVGNYSWAESGNIYRWIVYLEQDIDGSVIITDGSRHAVGYKPRHLNGKWYKIDLDKLINDYTG